MTALEQFEPTPNPSQEQHLKLVTTQDYLENALGHLTPQELMDAEVPDAHKLVVAELQMIALKGLKTQTDRDRVEMDAWKECHLRALHQLPAETGYYI